MTFKRCSIGTKGPKCAKKKSPTPLHHHQPEPLRQGRMDPCFHVLHAKFWLYHLNVAAEIKSNFGEFVWIVSSVCCSYLTGAAPGVVFCCWSPSASGFDVLCIQRWYSVYLGCNEWLFELLLPFYKEIYKNKLKKESIAMDNRTRYIHLSKCGQFKFFMLNLLCRDSFILISQKSKNTVA